METKCDPKAKVKQGDLGAAPNGKQPNQEATNIDFAKDAPRKGESETALQNNNYPTKSGSEHVQESLFKQADLTSLTKTVWSPCKTLPITSHSTPPIESSKIGRPRSPKVKGALSNLPPSACCGLKKTAARSF